MLQAQGILRACAFANEVSPLGNGPIDLMIKDVESLRRLQMSPERFVFFVFANGNISNRS